MVLQSEPACILQEDHELRAAEDELRDMKKSMKRMACDAEEGDSPEYKTLVKASSRVIRGASMSTVG